MFFKKYTLFLCVFMQVYAAGNDYIYVENKVENQPRRYPIHDFSGSFLRLIHDIFKDNKEKKYFYHTHPDDINVNTMQLSNPSGTNVFDDEDKTKYQNIAFTAKNWKERHDLKNGVTLVIDFKKTTALISIINTETQQKLRLNFKRNEPLSNFFKTLEKENKSPYYKLIINGNIVYPDYTTQQTIENFGNTYQIYLNHYELSRSNHLNLIPLTQEEFERETRQIAEPEQNKQPLPQGTFQLYDPISNSTDIITIDDKMATVSQLKNSLKNSKSLPPSRYQFTQANTDTLTLNNDAHKLADIDNTKIVFITIIPMAPGMVSLINEKPVQQDTYKKDDFVFIKDSDYKNIIGQIVDAENQDKLQINFGRHRAISKKDNIRTLKNEDISGVVTLKTKEAPVATKGTKQAPDLLIKHIQECSQQLALLSVI